MRDFKISLSGGALLGFSLIYFYDSGGVIAALIPAVIAHELGHAAVLLLQKSRLLGLRLTLAGFRMDYAGFPGRGGEFAMLAAGPACGVFYAIFAAHLGSGGRSEFLLCSAGISLVLSIFNLLPAPMLDGGQILLILFGARTLEVSGCLTGGIITLAGVVAAAKGYGTALTLAGGYILMGTCKWAKHSIK